MQKLEKSVQAPVTRVGSILLLTWIWRATLVGSLLIGYYGGRGRSSGSAKAAEPRLADPPACLMLMRVDGGAMCRLEVVVPQDICLATPLLR